MHRQRYAAGLAAALALSFASPPVAAQVADRARLIELAPDALTAELAGALALDVASHDGVFVPGAVNEVIARGRDLGVIELPLTIIARNAGKQAMPWHLTDARGLSKEANLSDFRGKWVLLEFWGHW